jgi:hypothetical protein
MAGYAAQSRSGRVLRIGLFAAFAVCSPAAEPGAQPPAPSAAVSVAEVEHRVRQLYIEGFPFEADADLSPEAVDRLAEMLTEEDERPYWSNIVLALGASGSPRALAPLADFAARRPTGKVDADAYEARMALPVALGHLAREQLAALAPLVRRARDRGVEPGWSFRSLDGASLAAILRRRAITGLAVSGLPEAEAVLAELAQQAAEEPTPGELVRHLNASRELRARVEREGPSRVFGRGAARSPRR